MSRRPTCCRRLPLEKTTKCVRSAWLARARSPVNGFRRHEKSFCTDEEQRQPSQCSPLRVPCARLLSVGNFQNRTQKRSRLVQRRPLDFKDSFHSGLSIPQKLCRDTLLRRLTFPAL